VLFQTFECLCRPQLSPPCPSSSSSPRSLPSSSLLLVWIAGLAQHFVSLSLPHLGPCPSCLSFSSSHPRLQRSTSPQLPLMWLASLLMHPQILAMAAPSMMHPLIVLVALSWQLTSLSSLSSTSLHLRPRLSLQRPPASSPRSLPSSSLLLAWIAGLVQHFVSLLPPQQ